MKVWEHDGACVRMRVKVWGWRVKVHGCDGARVRMGRWRVKVWG